MRLHVEYLRGDVETLLLKWAHLVTLLLATFLVSVGLLRVSLLWGWACGEHVPACARRAFIFSLSGRALPVWPLVFYSTYCAVVTAIMILLVPNYQNLVELKALQFPIQTLGECSFFTPRYSSCKGYL